MFQGNVLAAAVLVLAVASCGGPEPVASVNRDASRTIASAALFDAQRFAGNWQVVAAFDPEASCGVLSENWTALGSAGQFQVEGTTCTAAGLRGMSRSAEVYGPGRIVRHGPNGDEAIWVLWVDADYRVAVVGTPTGAFGRIMAREPVIRPDLLKSAMQIMAFNGYDISKLRMLR